MEEKIDILENKIIKLYFDEKMNPEEIIKSLGCLVSRAIIALKKDVVKIESDNYVIKITVDKNADIG